MKVPQGQLKVHYIFGVSSKASDGDTLCEKDGVNDRDIYAWQIEKVIVPKGEEYVAFEIEAA